ncbi:MULTISPECIES: bifunctional riboflavin kinase/FAD synthetase [unclassified Paenibacillus]|uniref:bifunctional riboflavin kinase/FAD synthetase n=1 Tax=unclassified Paenibacillus TaxID=185978 RepID=UPI0015A2D320|nr:MULTISPECIES: bifunctional riboflavin kinase/FAD synthetase [unclassified Paenibacillus]
MQTVSLSFPLEAGRWTGKKSQVLAIGDFDGVHLGHCEVIGRAVKRSRELGAVSAIMTFHPHPRQVLGLDHYVRLLTPRWTKREVLSELGVDVTYMVDFNESFMKLTPEEFVEHMLVPLNLDTVYVGFDFRFGYRGAGTPDTLCELAKGRFAVEVVRPFHLGGEKVSSTRIRQCLQDGKAREAAELLGRPYQLEGEVVHGDARGRTIGFPTANILLKDPYVLPANGVYAVRVLVGSVWHDGVMNIGVKPTFEGTLIHPTLEAHLFDFEDDIYGQTVQVKLIEFIRPERRFGSVQELIGQIARDADTARRMLAQPI